MCSQRTANTQQQKQQPTTINQAKATTINQQHTRNDRQSIATIINNTNNHQHPTDNMHVQLTRGPNNASNQQCTTNNTAPTTIDQHQSNNTRCNNQNNTTNGMQATMSKGHASNTEQMPCKQQSAPNMDLQPAIRKMNEHMLLCPTISLSIRVRCRRPLSPCCLTCELRSILSECLAKEYSPANVIRLLWLGAKPRSISQLMQFVH